MIGHVRIGVKKFRLNPTQCFNCFEYGHILHYSPNKCSICSAELEVVDICLLSEYCFYHRGNHSPNAIECPHHKLKQKIIKKGQFSVIQPPSFSKTQHTDRKMSHDEEVGDLPNFDIDILNIFLIANHQNYHPPRG